MLFSLLGYFCFQERGEEVFQMKERHIVAIMRKLKDTWKSVSDLTSRYYSLRDPSMNTYRQQNNLSSVVASNG